MSLPPFTALQLANQHPYSFPQGQKDIVEPALLCGAAEITLTWKLLLVPPTSRSTFQPAQLHPPADWCCSGKEQPGIFVASYIQVVAAGLLPVVCPVPHAKSRHSLPRACLLAWPTRWRKPHWTGGRAGCRWCAPALECRTPSLSGRSRALHHHVDPLASCHSNIAKQAEMLDSRSPEGSADAKPINQTASGTKSAA